MFQFLNWFLFACLILLYFIRKESNSNRKLWNLKPKKIYYDKKEVISVFNLNLISLKKVIDNNNNLLLHSNEHLTLNWLNVEFKIIFLRKILSKKEIVSEMLTDCVSTDLFYTSRLKNFNSKLSIINKGFNTVFLSNLSWNQTPNVTLTKSSWFL